MSSLPFLRIKARVFCQATESRERVLKALRQVMGDIVDEEGRLEEDRAMGHHNNPILVFTVEATAAREVRQVVALIEGGVREKMGRKERKRRELEQRLDEEGVLHLRLSKQAAYLGSVVVVDRWTPGGVIHVEMKVRMYPASRENALKTIESWI